MRPLLLTALVLISGLCYSQNAYYDMLELVRWSRLDDTSSEKKAKAELMLVKLLKYSGGPSSPFKTDTNLFIHKIYYKADQIYSFRERYKISRDYIINTIIGYDTLILARFKEPNDKKDVSRILELVEYVRRPDSLRYDSALTFLRDYERLTKAKHADLLRSHIGKVINKIYNQKLYNLDIADYNTQFTTVQWDDIKKGISDTVLSEKLEPIKAYIQMIYQYADDHFQKFKLDDDSIYNRAMALSSDAFRTVFPKLNLKPEEAYRSDDNRNYLFAKSTMEELAYQDLAGASNPQRLSDSNFPTQTEIIDALAIYLVKRAKQEAAILFIERLNDAIKSDELAQDLFPATRKVMQMEGAYTRPRFGSQWRNAIATDYIALPQNIMNSEYLKMRITDSALKNSFSDAVRFGTYVGRKYNFIDIMRTLHSDHSKLGGKWTSIGVDVMYIINEELYDSSQQRYWISPEALFELDTTQLFALYDLIRIKYKDKVCNGLKEIFKAPVNFKTKYFEKQRFYTELLTILQQFYVSQTPSAGQANGKDGFWDTQRIFLNFICDNANMLNLSSKEVQALKLCESVFYVYDYVSNKNYIATADHIIGIISTLLQNSRKGLVNIGVNDIKLLGANTDNFLRLLDSANHSFNDLLSLKSISSSLNNFADDKQLDPSYFTRLDLMEEMVDLLYRKKYDPLPVSELKKRLKKIDSSYAQRVINNYALLKSFYQGLPPSIKKNLNWDKKLLFRNRKTLTNDLLQTAHYAVMKENSVYFKWLTDFSGLLTEIVNARDRTSLANIIESHAMPTGSYRGKRNSNFSIDLNAYVGIYGGLEKISNDSAFHPVYGLTAPIGISFTWGTRRKKEESDDDLQKTYITKKGRLKYRTQNSFTLDLSLIDIGAVVSYRLSNSNESKGLPSEVKWDQVLSYGINARWGIKKTPLCFGIGAQKTPQLRSFNGKLQDAWRFHATFAFDLPLFNIYRSWD